MSVAVYDDGFFTQDISSFPLWDAGLFRFDFSDTQFVNCGTWAASFGVNGVDVSAAPAILTSLLDIVPTGVTAETLQQIQARATICVQMLQALSLGAPAPFDPVIFAMELITQLIQLAQQSLPLTSDSVVSNSLRLQIAALQLAYRLLQRVAAGLN